MTDRSPHVYVIQGRGQRDYADCQAALAHVPARMTALSFIGAEDELIARTRDADALVISSSPVTRSVMSALEGLKVVARTGVGYDVIDVPAATDLGVIVVNIPDIWVREVANHALALLLAWNRKVVTLDRQVHAGVWSAGVPGPHTGALHGETVGIVGLGNIGRAFARRVAAFETKVIACDPYVDDGRFAALGVERVSLEAVLGFARAGGTGHNQNTRCQRATEQDQADVARRAMGDDGLALRVSRIHGGGDGAPGLRRSRRRHAARAHRHE
jgi:lactate dehydrogenase-like 2-hydroxyacid dehydrogenase